LEWVHVAPVKPAELTESIARRVGGSGVDSSCQRLRSRWRCDIDDIEASGNASTYRVVTSGRRCWAAARTRDSYINPNLKQRARGCVRFEDRVRALL
jgi:hypothetical protein